MVKDTFVQLRLSREKKDKWENTARERDISLSQFIEMCVDKEIEGETILEAIKDTIRAELKNK